MKDIQLGNKANMNYRLKLLLEEARWLSDDGGTIQHIAFSPVVGEVFSPESRHDSYKKN
jgi:hypothetical protein